MKKSILMLAALMLCIGFTEVQAADYKWNDGGVHNFSGSLGGGRVYNNTTLNILNNGDIGHLEVEDTGKVNVLGSTANITNLSVYNSSEITITDGTVGLNCWDSSTTIVSGGTITRGFYSRAIIAVFESSRLDIYGGSFVNNVVVDGSSVLTIYGYDFAIDGTPVSAGSIFSVSGGSWDDDETWRHLTGTLDNGGVIDNDFKIGGSVASIVLVPEPTTLLLLGMGGLLIRKRK